jgi:hypothetical protein
MASASIATLPPPAFTIRWLPLCGLLLAAGGVFSVGFGLTGVATRAITSLEEPRREVWSIQVGTHSPRTGGDRLHQRAVLAPQNTPRAPGARAKADRLAASLRRAYLRNPLATAAVEPRGDAKTRKCPVCDVASGRTDAGGDRFEAAVSRSHDPPAGTEPSVGATFRPGSGARGPAAPAAAWNAGVASRS